MAQDNQRPTFMGFRGSRLSAAQTLLVMMPSFVIFGYNQSCLAGLLDLPDWVANFPRIDTIHTTGSLASYNSTLKGLVNAVLVLGALPACLSCSYTADKFGRKPVIATAAAVSIVGQVLEASAFSLPQMIIGRFILGAGVGALSGTVPTWQSECAPVEHRGRRVVTMGIFLGFGFLLQAWIELGLFQLPAGPATWRPVLCIPLAFCILLLVSIFMMPESPRWLVRQGRMTEARAVMSALKDLDLDSPSITGDIAAIEASLEETVEAASITDLFKMGPDRLAYRFGICMLLQFYQQMTGGSLIALYATIFFQSGLKLGSQTSRILSGAVLTWKFLASFVAYFCIDKLGRRTVLLTGTTGIFFSILVMTVTSSYPSDNKAAQYISVVFVFFFNFFVTIAFLGPNFLYCTEVAPLRMRVTMASFSTANHWLWNFVITMITPVAIDTIGYKYYIVFTVIAATAPVAIYFLYPETMGLSLEDIDLVFREPQSALSIVRHAREKPHRNIDERVLAEKQGAMADHKEAV